MALPELPTALVAGSTAASMFAGLFWMNARGLIITRREHEGRIGDKNEVIATQAKTIEVKDAQLEKVTVVGETMVKILESIDALGKRMR